VFTGNSWDGFQSDRDRLLLRLDSLNIDNIMIISGDAHFSMAMDVPVDAFDTDQYDPATGEGSVAVEFLPTSISRGNLDEMGFGALAGFAANISQSLNPHHLYSEFTEHGYGHLILDTDSIRARFMYTPILQSSNDERLGQELVLRSGDNHWSRGGPVSSRFEPLETAFFSEVYPNPSTQSIRLDYHAATSLQITATLYHLVTLQKLEEKEIFLKAGEGIMEWNIQDYPENYYLLILKGKETFLSRRFLKGRL
jgi:hypothetical protein